MIHDSLLYIFTECQITQSLAGQTLDISTSSKGQAWRPIHQGLNPSILQNEQALKYENVEDKLRIFSNMQPRSKGMQSLQTAGCLLDDDNEDDNYGDDYQKILTGDNDYGDKGHNLSDFMALSIIFQWYQDEKTNNCDW